jgi:hypothetical protein
MFDDAAKGLYREPFVCGIPEMLAALVTGIAEPYLGFALYFSDQEFPGFQFKVDLVEAEAGGNWYKMTVDGTEMKGWLCPALFKYFEAAPTSIYAKAEAMDRGPTPTAHGSFWQRLWSKL